MEKDLFSIFSNKHFRKFKSELFFAKTFEVNSFVFHKMAFCQGKISEPKWQLEREKNKWRLQNSIFREDFWPLSRKCIELKRREGFSFIFSYSLFYVTVNINYIIGLIKKQMVEVIKR